MLRSTQASSSTTRTSTPSARRSRYSARLADRPELRGSILLQSKCGIRFADDAGPKRYDASAAWITACDGTLARLGIELDVLLLHRPDPLMEPEEVARAFAALRAAGKVDHFGVSNMSGAQMRWLQSAIDSPLVANQIELGLGALAWLEEGVTVGQGAAAHVGFTAGTLEYCREAAVQLQAWSPLAQGRFSREHRTLRLLTGLRRSGSRTWRRAMRYR